MDAKTFLTIADDYRLGHLITEAPNPLTIGLAENAKNNLFKAISDFVRADLAALGKLATKLQLLPELADDIKSCWQEGGTVYVSGCGATGRLALALEFFARSGFFGALPQDAITGFMAGGDAALIRSIEKFEDFPEYGARQLRELGFSSKDLLIAVTEGGETPFVIGTCIEAAESSERKPWFLFCNPSKLLCGTIERSRRTIEHPKVKAFDMSVGPMALSGSTRLQATTVQLLVLSAAVHQAAGKGNGVEFIETFTESYSGFDMLPIAPLIEEEAAIYERKELLLYRTDQYGITVLTDTTERAPTFSLRPFEAFSREPKAPSWSYLSLPSSADSARAWNELLKRTPRTLDWPNVKGVADLETLLAYDISARASDLRKKLWPDLIHHSFSITGDSIKLNLTHHAWDLNASDLNPVHRHLLLKCVLNLHSTLVMGRIDRFQSNIMTFVKPSNNKLIDRAARYFQLQHQQQTGHPLTYEDAVAKVFASHELFNC